MPDITMCRGVGCELAETCYRSPASGTKPNELRQSWFVEEPFKVIGSKTGCRYYWEVESKKDGQISKRPNKSS